MMAWSAVHGVVSLLPSHAMKVHKMEPEVVEQLQQRMLQGISAALGRTEREDRASTEGSVRRRQNKLWP
jgi:hypothetical protein